MNTFSDRPLENDAAILLEHAIELHKHGAWREARALYEQIATENPQHSETLYRFGLLARDENNIQQAVSLFRKAITISNNQDHYYQSLGDTLAEAGDLSNALGAYKTAAHINPDNLCALVGAAEALDKGGDLGAALQTLHTVITKNPATPNACNLMAELLQELSFDGYQPELQQDLLICFNDNQTNHQHLAYLTATQLLFKYHIIDQIPANEHLTELVEECKNDSLLLQLLTKTINVNSVMERLIKALRKELLIKHHQSPTFLKDNLSLNLAIALQGFANEYVISIDVDETDILNNLTTSDNASEALIGTLLLKAMYEHQNYIDTSTLLTFCDGHQLASVFVTRTITEPQIEIKLSEMIDTFSTEQDKISARVQDQYEKNPYPRWQHPPRPKINSLHKLVNNLPGVQRQHLPEKIQHVLIAGCGTGFEPIEIALMDLSVAITAIDLSKASLAYGVRMANQLNLNNVNFLQGNILAARELNKKFDMVVSTGVLHHMEDPEEGWRQLCAITSSGGVMRISLYSKYARRRIENARQLISELGLTDSPHDIRKFRELIINSPAHSALSQLSHSDDLYSMSGCRDLLFHRQEQCFTFKRIETCIEQLGLTLIGMDLPHPSVNAQFMQMFPSTPLNNLHAWDQFEIHHPDTFAGMYQFWVQKN